MIHHLRRSGRLNFVPCCSDVWQLDGKTYTWTLLADGDPKFGPRERHGAVILSGGEKLCIICCFNEFGHDRF